MGTLNLHLVNSTFNTKTHKPSPFLLSNELSTDYMSLSLLFRDVPSSAQIDRLSQSSQRQVQEFVNKPSGYNFILIWVLNSILLKRCYTTKSQNFDVNKFEQVRRDVYSQGNLSCYINLSELNLSIFWMETISLENYVSMLLQISDLLISHCYPLINLI